MANLSESEVLSLMEKMSAAADEGISMVGGPQALSAALRCLLDRMDPLLSSYKNALMYAEERGIDPILPLTNEVQNEHTFLTMAMALVCALMMKDALGLNGFDRNGWSADMMPGGKPN